MIAIAIIGIDRSGVRDRTRSVRNLRSQWHAIDQMIDDRSGVARREACVPHAVGIDHGIGTVEAWPETAASRDHHIDRATREQLALHRRDQRVTPARTARGLARWAIIAAHKKMAIGHVSEPCWVDRGLSTTGPAWPGHVSACLVRPVVFLRWLLSASP